MPEASAADAPRESRLVVLAAVVGLLIVAAAIVSIVVLTGDDADGSSGLSDVQRYTVPPYAHVVGDVEYPQSPAVGGDQNDAWMACGVYDEPLREENVVHSLEHGTVWLTYRPDDVDEDGVEQLTGALPENGILSPLEEQDAPVVATVWGRQLELDGPDDPRLEAFVEEYQGGTTAPEGMLSCAGGITDPEGTPS